MASRRPKGLKALVLVSPAAAGANDIGDDMRHAIRHAYDSVASATFTIDQVLTARPLPPALRAQVLEDSMKSSRAARAAWPGVALLEDYSAAIRHIDVPTLVITGSADKVDPLAFVREQVAGRIQGARLEVLEGVGHLSPLEAPANVSSAIAGFLAPLA
jgi:pimeloyl-ACP methyl ester carboxylesterase